MTQLNLHTSNNPPPNGSVGDLSILKKCTDAYKLWHVFHANFSKTSRYTLGAKIDTLFTDTIELILWAGYSSRDQKLSVLAKASAKLDSLKFFLNLAWELKCLDHKKNAAIAPLVIEIGKILGAWIKQLKQDALPVEASRASSRG